MPKDLSCDIALSLDLYAHCRHLKRAPMLVLNQITQQSRRRLIVVLIRRIRYPRHSHDQLFCIWRAVNQTDRAHFTTSTCAIGQRAAAYCFARAADSAGILNFIGLAPGCFTVSRNIFVFAPAGALLIPSPCCVLPASSSIQCMMKNGMD